MANATEFIDSLGKAITKTADIVVKKTDEFISVQKLRGRKNVLETKLDNTFRNIGETVYANRKSGTESPEEIADLCRKIDALRQEIDECRREIAVKKGAKLCPACGAVVPREAEFCMKCGKPVASDTGNENGETAAAAAEEQEEAESGAEDQAAEQAGEEEAPENGEGENSRKEEEP